MIRHLLKLAFRKLNRKRGLSFLNIAGLTLGMACSMVIGLYVIQETSYEKGFANSDRTYRINTNFLNSGLGASSSYNLLPILSEQPEFEVVTNLTKVNNLSVNLGDKLYPLNGYFYADTAFHQVFDYDLLYGVAGSAFKNENSLILTTKEAERLFGRTDVVGETLIAKSQKLEVTAVLKPSFFKSHVQFNALWIKPRKPMSNGLWRGIGYYTYAVTHKGVKQQQIEERLAYVKKDFVFPGLSEALNLYKGYTYEQYIESGRDISLSSQPIKEIHLSADLTSEIVKGGDLKTIGTFALIAIFVLIISCANFINLTTAKASERTKELGIKKVLGTSRNALILQILAECIVLTLVAGIGSLALTELALSLMDVYFPNFITLSLFESPGILLVLTGCVVLLGVISGLYPAWYLSSFKITSLLKGQKVQGFSGGGFASTFRNSLVVIQFTLSTILIIGAIFIARQLNHMQQIDLGFDDDKVLVIKNAFSLKEQRDAFITEIERLPFVESTSTHISFPGMSEVLRDTGEELPNGGLIPLYRFEGSAGQFETLGIEMAYGRGFSEDFSTDENNVIINESAAAYFGDTTVIGSKISNQTVIGVVKDFHFQSLREPIRPVWFQLTDRPFSLAIRMSMTQENKLLVEEKWYEFLQKPIETYALSDNYREMLKEEGHLGRAFSLFTILAIFISCLGMYGLAVFTTDQRLRELSIRKVLGASVTNLISMLISNFLKLAMISLVLALPLSYLGVSKWLDDFAFRIDISSAIFIQGVFCLMIIVVVTVLHQSYRAAIRNPAETLKND